MNRVIKFRGLRTDGKGWVYGYYAVFTQRHIIYVDWDSYEVIPETVGQLLAVMGKDKEVYEGDILVNPKGRKHTVVIWDNIPCLHYMDKGRDFYQPLSQGFLSNKTVIGNIHEKEASNG